MTIRRRILMLSLPGALLIGGTAALARRAEPALASPFTGINLGPQEMTQQAADYMGKMNGVEARVVKLQDQARAKKDVIKLNCVSDKMVQIKGHKAVADQSMNGLQSAVGRNDTPAREHEFTR